MLLSLSSCFATIDLDEMKERHAKYEDENHEAIIFRGKRFILANGIADADKVSLKRNGRLTEADVPVLLSSINGGTFFYNDSLTFIRADYYDYDTDTDFEYNHMYYIREDFVEEYNKIISGKTDYLCYYVDWQKDPVIVTERQKEAIYAALSSSPVQLGGYECSFALYYCDPTFTIVYDAFTVHKGSYDSYHIHKGNVSYPVPDEYRDDIVSIVQNIKHKQKNNESN